jgi:LysR family transcriptional regulator, glycine cleavage system transcriptional activator
VAHHLNFTRAADALGVTVSAASLQIRGLEEYLGRPLFRRNGRQVELTSEGARVLPRVEQALQQLDWAVDSLRSGAGAGPLRVTMLASFLQQWLLPRLMRFRAAHPHVDLHLHSSAEAVDFVREEFHVAIRFGGTGAWPNVTAEKLLDEWLVPVCSPRLYEKCGPVRERDDVRRYPLLHSVSEPWTCWLLDLSAGGQRGLPRGDYFDDSQAVVRMALEGAGLALARWSLVADEISAGMLVAPGRSVIRFDSSYWLVYPQRIERVPAAQAFMQWLRAEAAGFLRPVES